MRHNLRQVRARVIGLRLREGSLLSRGESGALIGSALPKSADVLLFMGPCQFAPRNQRRARFNALFRLTRRRGNLSRVVTLLCRGHERRRLCHHLTWMLRQKDRNGRRFHLHGHRIPWMRTEVRPQPKHRGVTRPWNPSACSKHHCQIMALKERRQNPTLQI